MKQKQSNQEKVTKPGSPVKPDQLKKKGPAGDDNDTTLKDPKQVDELVQGKKLEKQDREGDVTDTDQVKKKDRSS